MANEPCVATFLLENQQNWDSRYFETGRPTANRPPFPDSQFFAIDTGNPHPKYVRSSMYRIPRCGRSFKDLNYPLSMMVTPFPVLNQQEMTIEAMLQQPDNPPCCSQCSAAMNGYNLFEPSGLHFECCFCGFKNQVPQQYFGFVNQNSIRMDRDCHLEMHRGIYDLHLGNGCDQKTPLYIFMVDITGASKDCDLFPTILSSLPSHLKLISNPDNCPQPRVALILFDEYLHFLDMRSSRPTLCSIVDFDDIFIPFLDGITSTPQEMIESLQRMKPPLESRIHPPPDRPSILGPALEFGLKIFEESGRCGKVLLFLSKRPTKNVQGNIIERNQYGAESEWVQNKSQLEPVTQYYPLTAKTFLEKGVGIDLFSCSRTEIDLATVGQLSTVTGGNIYWYEDFLAEYDGKALQDDIQFVLRKSCGFNTILEFRTHKSMKILGVYGAQPEKSTKKLSPDVQSETVRLACVNPDSTLQYDMDIDPKTIELPEQLVFQATIEFTDVFGNRWKRVINLCIGTTTDLEEVVDNVDWSVWTSHFLKLTDVRVREGQWTVVETRKALMRALVFSLSSIRRRFGSDIKQTSLFIPPTFRPCPLVQHAIANNLQLFPTKTPKQDGYAFHYMILSRMTPKEVVRFVLPKVYRMDVVHHLEDNLDPSQIRKYLVRPANYYLEERNLYFIENGINGYLWIGTNASEEKQDKYLALKDDEELTSRQTYMIRKNETQENKFIHDVLEYLNKDRPRRLSVQVTRSYSSTVYTAESLLVEDEHTLEVRSYSRYLREIHTNIQMMTM
ncbi:unnamed protein product [Bursaphelenchus okinawaensis]|uniref:Uncharacterized protein n=1 Tax=Bursaphelenchus okinawaensis TaxID=465554 RepID=A0A811LJR8_9BILA|nr:unnamed protein product [Bursaphelenchus okinawaensis]CAG9124941.1 unnamed protein product [Bursaphelenchus okinawaensis]